MAFIVIGLITADSYLHKGMVRVMFPKKYPEFNKTTKASAHRYLVNTNKNWVKAVNSLERMNKRLDKNSSGMECDVYFDVQKNTFDVHHDPGNSTSLDLETLLTEYKKLKLEASIWLDFKNLDDSIVQPSLKKLLQLRDQYRLYDKILVESSRADLLQHFSDAGFFTSYYTPTFNPYMVNDDSLKYWVDSISKEVNRSQVDALSGYYFQYSFLHKYFPGYHILAWAPDDKFSMVNWLFRRKINAAREVFIVLYP